MMFAAARRLGLSASFSLARARGLMTSTGKPRTMCAAAGEQLEGQYALGLRWLHWLMGGSMLVCMGTVKASQWTTGDTFLGSKGKTKGTLMMIHKSTAVLVAVMLPMRLGLRLVASAPPAVPGPVWEKLAATLSHVSLYGFMAAMPATGLAMGYYGGKGIPQQQHGGQAVDRDEYFGSSHNQVYLYFKNA